MVACAVCRTENRDDARFCNTCGSRLSAPVAVVEERKVITALFCDLVGFTATSEGADPEDVDRMLSRYAAMAREVIETHGGVVEKFIGDAVVGVFGVPAAHEDDPERAIRAALRICERAGQLPALHGQPLRLRVGVNTGEALVRLEVGPTSGDRFLAGDTVNTASRIQSVAPEMGVAVGLVAYEATRRRFEYQELPPATLKGKAEPVRVFHPIAPVARHGTDLPVAHAGTAFVGRAAELATLIAQFEAVIATSSMRFVTIVGEPGLGKSRLLGELFAHVEATPILVTWRQGRCPPYGTGIAFWALGEVVKAQTGILESDSVEVAQAKLERAIPDIPEHAWLRERLLPLVGIESASRAEREEQFAAWRRFLELVAADRPAVVVLEDLHWADEALLAFLEELVEKAPKVPLLVVGTARPELGDRRPGFPATGPLAVRIELTPLAPEESAAIAAGLVGASGLDPALRDILLEHAGGNPLFVEEVVRLLVDRDLLVAGESGLGLPAGTKLPIPDSVQGVLAARIDGLPPGLKGALADASVLGKVFWAGAAAAVGGREADAIGPELDDLVAREWIRPAARSSMAGETEFSFRHIMARDVAYARLPRAARAMKHTAAGRWIEGKAGDRLEDAADILAYHYSTALELSRTSGAEGGDDLAGSALRFLTLAGERALQFDAEAAVDFLGRARGLVTDRAERADADERYGLALGRAGRFRDAVEVLEAVIDANFAAGRPRKAGSAMLAISDPLRMLGRMPRTYEAVALLEPLGPSIELANALVRMTSNDIYQGQYERCIERVRQIRALADALEGEPGISAVRIQRLRLSAMAAEGEARLGLGDAGGLEELASAATAYVERGDGLHAATELHNVAVWQSLIQGPEPALVASRRNIEFCVARGLQLDVLEMRNCVVAFLIDGGEFPAALAEAATLERIASELGAGWAALGAAIGKMEVAMLTGTSVSDADRTRLDGDISDAVEDPVDHGGVLLASAYARHALGDAAGAAIALDALSRDRWTTNGFSEPRILPRIARICLAIRRPDVLERFGGKGDAVTAMGDAAERIRAAVLAELAEDPAAALPEYEAAAATYATLGVRPEAVHAQLGQARGLLALGRPSEAADVLQRARDDAAGLRMAPATAEASELLAGLSPERPRAGRPAPSAP